MVDEYDEIEGVGSTPGQGWRRIAELDAGSVYVVERCFVQFEVEAPSKVEVQR